MKQLNKTTLDISKNYPVKVLQFGEGNFLRAFVDFALDTLNKETDFNGAVAVVQPIEHGLVQLLNEQDGLYTLLQKGVSNGTLVEKQDVISVIDRSINPFADFKAFQQLAFLDSLAFVISNTTEAGIAFDKHDTYDGNPSKSFPGKLTYLLHQRYLHFDGDLNKGLTIIPCELINHNGDQLKKCIEQYCTLWGLSDDFLSWVQKANSFHNTLVDRIVPGYPKNEAEQLNAGFGYEDKLIVSAEAFFLWVIEGDDALKQKLPFNKTNLNVKFVDSIQPYRNRKVRILNGIHTAMVPFCYLHGLRTVKESIDDSSTGAFIQKTVFEEIIPSVDMDKAELEEYANEVFDRFRNPFIVHKLESIALNSISKFKVRVLPSILSFYEKFDKLPKRLSLAFASLLVFYQGKFNGENMPLNDDDQVISFFTKAWEEENLEKAVEIILSNEEIWGQDLTTINGLHALICTFITDIQVSGVQATYTKLF